MSIFGFPCVCVCVCVSVSLCVFVSVCLCVCLCLRLRVCVSRSTSKTCAFALSPFQAKFVLKTTGKSGVEQEQQQRPGFQPFVFVNTNLSLSMRRTDSQTARQPDSPSLLHSCSLTHSLTPSLLHSRTTRCRAENPLRYAQLDSVGPVSAPLPAGPSSALYQNPTYAYHPASSSSSSA